MRKYEQSGQKTCFTSYRKRKRSTSSDRPTDKRRDNVGEPGARCVEGNNHYEQRITYDSTEVLIGSNQCNQNSSLVIKLRLQGPSDGLMVVRVRAIGLQDHISARL